MVDVLSNRWHKMNATVNEISRTTERLAVAMCHCMTNPNSMVKGRIQAIADEREKLYRDLDDQCTEWLEKLEKEKTA